MVSLWESVPPPPKKNLPPPLPTAACRLLSLFKNRSNFGCSQWDVWRRCHWFFGAEIARVHPVSSRSVAADSPPLLYYSQYSGCWFNWFCCHCPFSILTHWTAVHKVRYAASLIQFFYFTFVSRSECSEGKLSKLSMCRPKKSTFPLSYLITAL